MAISRRSIAREWLIFVVLFLTGGIICFSFRYYQTPYVRADAYTHLVEHLGGLQPALYSFWNHLFGFDKFRDAILWFWPYIIITFLRSIGWAVRLLSRGNDR